MAKLIETYTDELKKDGFTVEVCGWSYGGAMAVLAAEDFNFRTGNNAGVVTFGAPKPLWGRKTWQYIKSCVAYAEKNGEELWSAMDVFRNTIATRKTFLALGKAIETTFCSEGE